MLKKIAAAIAITDHIVLLPHAAADGDALGSSFALALTLHNLGKHVRVVLEEQIPQIYAFLPGATLSEQYAPVQGESGEGLPGQYDMAIAIDCGDIDRLGERAEIFKSARVTAVIDHHPTNTSFAKYNYLETSASATAEIIFQLLEILGAGIDTDISTCLYVGIITDTGGFRYSNTIARTHRIAADLLQSGIDVADISRRVFDTVSLEKTRLIGEAVRAMELFENGRIAVITLTEAIMRKTGAKEEDCDGIINMARNIRGVEVAAMLRRSAGGKVKVNLRSNTEAVDVSAIASAYGGGGHKMAAGYTVKDSCKQAKATLLAEIKEVL